jgi:hypothetical protein
MDHARVLAGQTEVTEPAITLAIGAATGTRFIVLVVFILVVFILLILFFLFIKIGAAVFRGLGITSLFNRADIGIDEFTDCIVKLLLHSTRREATTKGVTVKEIVGADRRVKTKEN